MINKKRLVETFLELVTIDSPSGSEDKIAKHLEKKLQALGAIVTTDSYGNVIGKISGTGSPFMLNAHMDTVEPGRGIRPIIEGDIIKTDETTVLGGDPKAGISIILETIASLKEQGKAISLEIVFTRSEETGLLGAFNLDYSLITAKNGLTFDGEEKVTNVDIASPGYNKVDAEITGRAAHAGAEPEKGISAIQIAAEIISKLKLGRIDHETTANVGLIEGGSARNAVPETVTLQAEIRSRDMDKLATHTKHFQEVFNQVLKDYPQASIDLQIEREFDPYKFTKDHVVIQKISKVMKEMNLVPNLYESGGGTDVNVFHTNGIEAAVVGTGGYNAHTKREYVKISEMLEAATFCEKFLLS